MQGLWQALHPALPSEEAQISPYTGKNEHAPICGDTKPLFLPVQLTQGIVIHHISHEEGTELVHYW